VLPDLVPVDGARWQAARGDAAVRFCTNATAFAQFLAQILRNRPSVEAHRRQRTKLPRVVEAFGVSRRSVQLGVVLAAMLLAAPAALARTYYVSTSGHDQASGMSPAHAWRTMFRVDKARLHPGDTVLFQGGARFSDQTLMPGWGIDVSGTSGAPVTFGSFGNGRAILPKGIWIKGERHLVFESLDLGPGQGVTATGSYDTVQYCSMRYLTGSMNLGVNAIGSHWLIRDNVIDHTANSGMLLRGDHFEVSGNTITNTGVGSGVGYDTHGIYLDVSNATIVGNTIRGFRNDGVSVRYRNSVVTGNTISGGKFGIAFFQFDSRMGTSWWTNNTIDHASVAAIYVSPSDIGGATHENFVITGNKIYRPSGGHARAASGWRAISLSHDRGRYVLRANVLL
jgi:parallel beta-helix repeat protein